MSPDCSSRLTASVGPQMESLGVILSLIGAAVTIVGTVLILRVPGSKFENRGFTYHELGGGKAVALYISAIRVPTILVVIGTSTQLLGILAAVVA